MQQGSVIREHRKLGPDVWCYRWWESGAERQPSTPPDRFGHCRAIARHGFSSPDDGGIGAGNKCFRYSNGRKIHDTGAVG